MQKQNDAQIPFVALDGVAYINETLIQKAKFTSESTDAQGQPLVEIDLKKGEFTLRAAESKAQLNVQFTSSGKLAVSGLGLGVSDVEKAKEQGFGSITDYLASFISGSKLATDLERKIDNMELIKEAAIKGAIAGYQAALKEINKTS
ncbi:hypothetical protein [Pseudomonas sp. Hg5Tf]|uniref:DUF1983 domain-containing protein n=1 Tax=Pseudomonas sp. Hg7Tf TaxID=3236988 RepID=A0AB39I6G5_9PSED|nr:hypothetical protein [Pseudomonas sp. Hg5Tf]MDH2558413.1 hypothetical protein [Pseudomonas sp. Hg5Tf]